MIVLLLITLIFLFFIIFHYVNNWKYYKTSLSVPGPWSLPFLGSIWFLIKVRNDPLYSFVDEFEKYDKRMGYRVGNRYILISSNTDDIQKFFTNSASINKLGVVYDKLIPIVGQGLIISKGEHWKKQRKEVMPSFTKGILDTFGEDMYLKSDSLVKNLRENCSKEFQDISYFTYNFAIEAYCINFMNVDVEDINKKHHWGQLINKANKNVFERMMNPFYAIDSIYLRTSLGKDYLKNIEEILKYSQKLYEASIEADSMGVSGKKTNLVESMVSLKNNKKITDEELSDQLTTILVGGTDTTALALSFIFVVLGTLPEIQQRVYEEIIEVTGRSKPITISDLVELKYTERVINEVLRLFPIVPQLARELTTDLDLGDIILPAGSGAAVLVFDLHRREEYWPNPLKFDPDRFLPEECQKRNPYTYLPFSIGLRNCPGLKYAMMEMKMATANCVRNFVFFSKFKSIEEIKVVSHIFIKIQEGFMCKWEPRI